MGGHANLLPKAEARLVLLCAASERPLGAKYSLRSADLHLGQCIWHVPRATLESFSHHRPLLFIRIANFHTHYLDSCQAPLQAMQSTKSRLHSR